MLGLGPGEVERAFHGSLRSVSQENCDVTRFLCCLAMLEGLCQLAGSQSRREKLLRKLGLGR